jgi:hypothetical protein
MNLDTVLSKTPRARAALQRGDALSRPQRLFLLMIDGRTPLRDLSPVAKALGVDHRSFAALVNGGMLREERVAA